MALKVGDRPTVRLPTFEIPRFPSNRIPIYDANQSTFEVGRPPPMVMPTLPPNPASIPGYGTPDALKDVFEDLSRLPGLQAGVTEEARKAAIAQARDTIIAKGRERGLDLMLNKKANGELSLDALAWRKPDGSVSIIDFGLASKDTSRAMKFQWLDVTDGGGAPADDSALFTLNGLYDGLIKAWSKHKGLKSGATAAERNAAMTGLRDDFIAQGRAAGLDLALNVDAAGQAAVDSVVLKTADGQQRVIKLADGAGDLTRDVELTRSA